MKYNKKLNKSELTCNVQLRLQIVQGICMHFQGCNMLSALQLGLQTPLQWEDAVKSNKKHYLFLQ